MRSSLLLLVSFATATATATATAPFPAWSTYTAAVIFKRNHPSSVAAKNTLQGHFCSRFAVDPCSPRHNGSNNDTIHIARDLDIVVPRSRLTEVVAWLQQNRLGLVGGASYDLDVMLYPNDNTGLDPSARAVFIGHRAAYNTNLLDTVPVRRGARGAATAASAPAAASIKDDAKHAIAADMRRRLPATAAENDTLFTQCSSDATCSPPYANNTGCTGDEHVASFHFHFYYVANDPHSVNGANAYINATEREFSIDPDVCPDNDGHEQPHNTTCWLSGPGGGGALPRPNNVTHQGPGGSFTYPVFSLYVTRDDFEAVLAWTMIMKNEGGNGGEGNGYGDIDFLVHPNTGCNYADHVFWGLHATVYIPANLEGCAEEAGWDKAVAPAVDPDSVNYPGNAAVEGCGLVAHAAGAAARQQGAQQRNRHHREEGEEEEEEEEEGEEREGREGREGKASRVFPLYALHIFFDGSNADSTHAEAMFTDGLTAAAAAAGVPLQVGPADARAFLDTTKVALTGERMVTFGPSALGAVVPWMLLHRPTAKHLRLDVLLVRRRTSIIYSV
jgi:aromatic ring-cleaving dioxygenase